MANSDINPEERRLFLNEVIEILRNNCAGISEVNEPPFPYLTTIMRREFQPGLEEYLKTSTAGRKTLREIIDYFEANPETMLKYGNDLLRGALADTPRDLSEDAEYLKAMQARKDAIRSITDEISDYDAVLMTGPTYVMHFCGLTTITVAGGSLDTNSVRQAVILYGTDEYRLYAAALAVEQLLNSKA